TFADTAAITVVLASEGYPEVPVTGRPIEGLRVAASIPGVHLAHAATAGPDAPDGDLISTGGRVLNVVAVGDTFAQARERAYAALDEITLEGAHFRRDIAAGVVES
ncbi:MAG TPA: phosphoribosylglycinamide synthetase C domain-containing protein, partial [Microbacterium sp.]|nr:phosphoribosylglycinamide synthetase C domain-containing protein [Microbacterium sp.]